MPKQLEVVVKVESLEVVRALIRVAEAAKELQDSLPSWQRDQEIGEALEDLAAIRARQSRG